MKFVSSAFILLLLIVTNISQADTTQELNPGAWVPIPVIGSSPETGFELGAYVMRILPEKMLGQSQDRFEFIASGTTKGLFQLHLWPTINLSANSRIKGGIGGQFWPGSYLGIGNEFNESMPTEDYDSTQFDADVWYHYQILPNIWFASGLVLVSEQIEEDASISVLDASVAGFQGGNYHGIGSALIKDVRDNADFPSNGYLLSATTTQFFSEIGSDFNFGQSEAKASWYRPIGDNNVIGFGARLKHSTGDVPFRQLAAPQGTQILRGANSAKYIDRNLLSSQIDFRMPLNSVWGLDFFYDIAQVQPDLNFELNDFHYSLGGGVRFNTLQQDRLNIRLDIGVVDAKDLGIVISIGEAF